MNKPLIKVSQLSKVFQDGNKTLKAINNVSFEINRGDYIAILGRSGSGKSTLLSVLGLLDSPTNGKYELIGCDTNTLSFFQKSVLRNKHMGWIFQNFNLINDMTVLDNVILPLKYNKSIKSNRYRAMGYDALKKVSLEDKADSYPSQLSGGQQQRIAIARALVTEPDIILADEPTGNLDRENGQAIVKLLHDINQKGVTVLLVTHDNEIAAQCKQSLTIDNGEIVASSNLLVVS